MAAEIFSWLPWIRREEEKKKIEEQLAHLRETKRQIRAEHGLDQFDRLTLDILEIKEQGAEAMKAAAVEAQSKDEETQNDRDRP